MVAMGSMSMVVQESMSAMFLSILLVVPKDFSLSLANLGHQMLGRVTGATLPRHECLCVG